MQIPEKLGKYQITGVLGKGAMGVVYKGFDPDIRRVVAVKTIRKDATGDSPGMADLFAARFRHEAQAAGRLTHPGIVGIYEYGEDAGYTYIAMEFVEGYSLREYFQRNVPFEEKDVVSLMSQLLEGLQAAHEQGVWHRDIKPANLIVTSAGKLKIADFGIARLESSELTQVSDMLGTHGYMAPESYQGLPVDHRTDLFAAGSVFYQLLAWEAPFSGPAEAVMYRVCNIDPPAPSQRDTDRCWAHYDTVVAMALAKEPARRYQSAEAFRMAVQEAYAKPVVSSISETTIIATRPSVPDAGAGAGAGAGSAAGRGSAASAAGQAGGTGTGGQSGSGSLPSNWDATVLTHIETCLARYVGPVAKVMVRRTARESTDLPTLVEQLAAQLPSDDDRKAFGAAVPNTANPATRASWARGGRTVVEGASRYQPDDAEIARATQALSAFLGPIARVLVKRAAADAPDPATFRDAVAQHVEDPDDRKRLLQALSKA